MTRDVNVTLKFVNPGLNTLRACSNSNRICSRTLWVLTVLLSLTLCSCAYQFGQVKRNIPGNYDKVAVPVFRNPTSEVGIETYFTKAMIEEVERSHLAQVVDKEQAQIIIEGEILSVDYAAGAQIDSATATNLPAGTVLTNAYRILVNTRVEARRRSDQKIIWSGTFLGEKRYPAPQVTKPVLNTVNPLYNHSSRHQNIEVMARDIMSEAYSRMTENF